MCFPRNCLLLMPCGGVFFLLSTFWVAEEKGMVTLASIEEVRHNPRAPREIEVPASTAWPIVLAFGFTLLFAGLLTSASVSVLGAVLAVAGSVGWFREVLPHEHEEVVPVVPEEVSITTERRVVEWLPVAPELVRSGVSV